MGSQVERTREARLRTAQERQGWLNEPEHCSPSDASPTEFKALVVRMLTELIELGRKMKEEMKATQSEIKENVQGTNSDRKETGTQINNLKQ